MNQSSLDRGLLGIARRGSAAALIVCLVGWAVLGTITLVNDGALSNKGDLYLLVALGILSSAAVSVQMTARVLRQLRKIEAALTTEIEEPASTEAGLDPESLTLARQLSARLHSVS